MKRFVLASVLAVAATFVLAPTADAGAQSKGLNGDTVRSWNNLALNTVKTKSASDAQAARLYAMVNVAMYDAVNGLAKGDQRRTSALVAPTQTASGDPRAAAAGAAHDVLTALNTNNDPNLAASYNAQLESDLAAVQSTDQATKGRNWGGTVASEVLAARANDGSNTFDPGLPGSTEPGEFRANWTSGVQFRHLTPFAIANSDSYLSPGHPELKSPKYAKAFNEVKVVGKAGAPDAPELADYTFWSLNPGTSQPPGAWLQVARSVSAQRSLSLADTARLFTLQSMTMADTVAPTYQTKYVYHFWRPTTAIIDAEYDDNNRTDDEDTWQPRGGQVGGSPEHWSGHSSFSASAASVLAGFFCNDQISFSLTTDSAPNGQARTYQSFSQAAAEAGRSRVVGGLHFEFSNQAGLTAGRAIAAEVLSGSLLRTQGPTHSGSCPL